jgi:hypothetical protein
LHANSVGKLLVPGKTSWPEVSEFNYFDGGTAELMLRLTHPSAATIQSIRHGPATFALAPIGDVLFFLYAFSPALPWSAAPFSWHLVHPDRRQSPPTQIDEPEGQLLQIVLVDAASGIVEALRVITLTPDFTRALYDAIRRQVTRQFPGRTGYDAQLAEAYREYPTTADLLNEATASMESGP